MQKKVILIALATLIFFPFANADAFDGKKKSYIHITPAQPEKSYSGPDFRKARWGMSIHQIKAIEKNDPFQENNDWLMYYDTMMGMKFSVHYGFCCFL